MKFNFTTYFILFAYLVILLVNGSKESNITIPLIKTDQQEIDILQVKKELEVEWMEKLKKLETEKEYYKNESKNTMSYWVPLVSELEKIVEEYTVKENAILQRENALTQKENQWTQLENFLKNPQDLQVRSLKIITQRNKAIIGLNRKLKKQFQISLNEIGRRDKAINYLKYQIEVKSKKFDWKKKTIEQKMHLKDEIIGQKERELTRLQTKIGIMKQNDTKQKMENERIRSELILLKQENAKQSNFLAWNGQPCEDESNFVTF